MTMNLSSKFDAKTRKMFVDIRDWHEGDAIAAISQAIQAYWGNREGKRPRKTVGVRSVSDDNRVKRMRKGVELVRVWVDFMEGVYQWSHDHKVTLHKLSMMAGFKHPQGLSCIMSRLRVGKTYYTKPGIIKRLEAITGLKNCPATQDQPANHERVSKPKDSKNIRVRVCPAYAIRVKREIFDGGYTLAAVSDTIFGSEQKLKSLLHRIEHGQKDASEYDINMIEQFTKYIRRNSDRRTA